MRFLQSLFGKKERGQSSHENEEADLNMVEDLVENLRQKPPNNAICFVVLFGDRPLTAELQGAYILSFTHKRKAEEFMTKYQSIYYCEKPLSILALRQLSELWAMLNNKAKDRLYEPPYGLLINFSYSGQPYNKYSIEDLKRIGFEGFKKGFSSLSK